MGDYYDRAGKPMTVRAWAEAFEKADRRVAFTQIPAANAEVSTVYLGLDHSWGSGPPLIFETLVFGGDLDGEMERYSTEEEARAGHEEMVNRVRFGRSDNP